MRTLTSLALAIGLALHCSANGGVIHKAALPEGWGAQNSVQDDHKIQIRFSVKRTNLDQLKRIAREVSDPTSVKYGQYLTSVQLQQLTKPTEESIRVVTDWLNGANVNFHMENAHLVVAELTSKDAAALLSTTLQRYVNDVTGQEVVRAGDFEIPAAVDAVLSAVHCAHGLPLPPREALLSNATATVAQVTPAVIIKTYNVAGVTPSGSTKNRQAVAEFQSQTMKPSDLTTFFTKYVPNAPSTDAKIDAFVGDTGTGSGGVEASLDVDYIMGNAPGLLTEFWYYNGNDFCGDLEQWTSKMLSTDDVPLVHSVSYGWQGQLSQVQCTTAKTSDVDTNFQKLAAKGITIIFASGDSGSGHKKGIPIFGKDTLYPSWPASSPWVTAVGSTRFQNQKVGQPEQATDQFGSGGGFSTMFDAFDAQKDAVKNYLATAPGLPPSTMFPAGGRATPDVSALGEGYEVVSNGGTLSVGGTSASAPTFASLVSLLNEARLNAGKPAMGYLNTWLYQNPDAFTDITVGSNKIGRGGGTLKYGYECAKGWDPVTGLGTPLFGKMLKAAMGTTSDIVV